MEDFQSCEETQLFAIRVRPESIASMISEIQHYCHNAAILGGWHNDLQTGKPRTPEQNDALFPTRIALTHAELSEALEAHRKGLTDDHLPHRRGAEVEIADTIIRLLDLAGAMGYDIGGALAEKVSYNLKRADHKKENRQATGGKAY